MSRGQIVQNEDTFDALLEESVSDVMTEEAAIIVDTPEEEVLRGSQISACA